MKETKATEGEEVVIRKEKREGQVRKRNGRKKRSVKKRSE